jgi:hypothetical protein
MGKACGICGVEVRPLEGGYGLIVTMHSYMCEFVYVLGV